MVSDWTSRKGNVWSGFNSHLLQLSPRNISVNGVYIVRQLYMRNAPYILKTLLYISVVPSFKPGFPSEISASKGTDVTIDCHVSVGSCNWYKNAVKILSLSSPRLSVAANGSLLIRTLTEADSGLYQVFARTNVNEISLPTVRLLVVGK